MNLSNLFNKIIPKKNIIYKFFYKNSEIQKYINKIFLVYSKNIILILKTYKLPKYDK